MSFHEVRTYGAPSVRYIPKGSSQLVVCTLFINRARETEIGLDYQIFNFNRDPISILRPCFGNGIEYSIVIRSGVFNATKTRLCEHSILSSSPNPKANVIVCLCVLDGVSSWLAPIAARPSVGDAQRLGTFSGRKLTMVHGINQRVIWCPCAAPNQALIGAI